MHKSIHYAAFAAAMLLAGSAQALTIGQIEVKSGLGDNFDATIPVTLAAGEDVTTGCVRIEDSANTRFKDVPLLTGYAMKLERGGSANAVLIRLTTNRGLSEPTVRIDLAITCGAKVSISREFIVQQNLSNSHK